jgi:uncharacterized membrane protein
MGKGQLAAIARVFVALGMAAFGIHQLAYGHFARWVASPPAWVPMPAILPYVTGLVFLVGAGAILFGRQARIAALVLTWMILAIAVLFHPFEIAAHPSVADLWGRAGKAFALSGAAALVAGSLRGKGGGSGSVAVLGPIFVGLFFCIAGVEHFIYARFVVQMIPAWIPAHLFWTYFTAVALLAGGIGMNIHGLRGWLEFGPGSWCFPGWCCSTFREPSTICTTRRRPRQSSRRWPSAAGRFWWRPRRDNTVSR